MKCKRKKPLIWFCAVCFWYFFHLNISLWKFPLFFFSFADIVNLLMRQRHFGIINIPFETVNPLRVVVLKWLLLMLTVAMPVEFKVINDLLAEWLWHRFFFISNQIGGNIDLVGAFIFINSNFRLKFKINKLKIISFIKSCLFPNVIFSSSFGKAHVGRGNQLWSGGGPPPKTATIIIHFGNAAQCIALAFHNPSNFGISTCFNYNK